MNSTPLPCCKHCRFYHGADRLVCAVHPDGPDSERCLDFEARPAGQHPAVDSKARLIHASRPWDARRKLLIASLLAACFGYGVALWWAETSASSDPSGSRVESQQSPSDTEGPESFNRGLAPQ